MAGKTTTTTTTIAAALCFVLIVVLSAPVQQVSASKFCDCYRHCFPDCRKSLSRGICLAKCTDDCIPNAHPPTAATGGTGWCKVICGLSYKICGLLSAAPADAHEDAAGEASCVRDCVKQRKNHGSMV